MNEDIKLLQQKLDNHIDEYHMHVQEENNRWDHLITITEKNSTSIHELALSTRDIVDAWKAADGAIRVGVTVGKFVKWLTSLAIVGAAFTWLFSKFAP